jgi:hypothetical protein
MAGPWTSTSRTGVPPRPAGGPAAATAARGCPVVGALQDQERRPAGSDIAERAGAWVPVSRSSSGVDGSRQRQPDIPTERRALRTAQACADAPPAWLPPRFLARGLRQRPRGRRPGRVARAPVTTLAPGARADLRSDRGCGWPGAAGQPGGEAQPTAPRPARPLARSDPSRPPIGWRWSGQHATDALEAGHHAKVECEGNLRAPADAASRPTAQRQPRSGQDVDGA